jgi:hypothetical protein
MAVTFAVTNLTRDVTSKRLHRGTITATGTTTAGGDAIAASALGLSVIDNLDLANPSYNGTLAFQARYNRGTGKIQFFGTNATPGAAVADPEITAGTSVSTYAVEFEAVGR